MFTITPAIYDTLLAIWKWFPLIGPLQMALPHFYLAGKTSATSSLNIPGRLGWFLMEITSPSWFIYALFNASNPNSSSKSILEIPSSKPLFLASLYLIHYVNRAIVYPYLSPGIAPMHLIILLIGLAFNFVNPVLMASWLSSYGTIKTSNPQFTFGIIIWAAGFLGNLYHEHLLREIRLKASEAKKEVLEGEQTEAEVNQKPGTIVTHDGRIYMIPKGGLFKWVLHPHYFCEWIEWTGFAIAAGSNCAPAILFLVNEISTMLPRAFQQKTWYEEKFGKRLNPRIKAVIPFVL